MIETEIGSVPEEDLSKWKLVIHYMAPIIEHFLNPDITDIMVNRYDRIFVEGHCGMREVDSAFESEADLQQFIRQLSIVLNQDHEYLALLDARFPDQSRACCTMPCISTQGATVTIRCAPKRTLSFDDLIECGAITDEMAGYIREHIEKKSNIIVSGSTGSGKTTLLRALAEFIPNEDRVIICEDTQELRLNLFNLILMEAPNRSSDDISLSDLVKISLRQRPDRILIGEIRDAFACDAFLQAINTGHGGCATSIHANNPEDAIRRIQYLLNKEGLLSYELAGSEVRHSVDLIIQVKKTPFGRRVTGISCMDFSRNIQNIFSFDEVKSVHSSFL